MPETKIRKDSKLWKERRQAISEAFHSLNQPLTSLHCGLEIGLLKATNVAEYQQRLQDALVNAGEVLRLSRALRELVEASDPGEQFGSVAIESIFDKLREDIGFVAEAAKIAIHVRPVAGVFLDADPSKLHRCLGAVFDSLICELNQGGSIELTASSSADIATLRFNSSGDQQAVEEEDRVPKKLREIRMDAAAEYVRTLGGQVTKSDRLVELMIPLTKAHQTSLPAARSRTIGASASRKS